jgi:hypothetical protein
MKRLREAVKRKRPEAWTNKTWMLHHDNAPPHTSLLIREFVPSRKTRSRTHSRTGKNAGSGVSTVEGCTLKERSLIEL